MEIRLIKIPYDIDVLWDGGCEGADLWGDGYGEHVNLLISDSGSAYVCPEGRFKDWRIYVDRTGRPWRIPLVPGMKKGSESEPKDASQKCSDIIACGLKHSPQLEESLANFLSIPRTVTPIGFLAIFDDIEFETTGEGSYFIGDPKRPYKTGHWTVRFDDTDIVMKKDSERENALYLRGLPFPTNSRNMRNCGLAPDEFFGVSEDCSWERKSSMPNFVYVESLFRSITANISPVEMEDDKALKRLAIRSVEIAIDSAREVAQDILEFEALCEQTHDVQNSEQL